MIIAIAAIGLTPLALVGGRYERAGRFAFFAFDAALVSAVVAFAPISSGGDVPQNFVFFSSRHVYYYVVLAVSILSLSPALVLWTGFCAVLTRRAQWRVGTVQVRGRELAVEVFAIHGPQSASVNG